MNRKVDFSPQPPQRTLAPTTRPVTQPTGDNKTLPRAQKLSPSAQGPNIPTSLSVRNVANPNPKIELEEAAALHQLEASASNLVNAVLNQDTLEAKNALNEFNLLIASPLSSIQIAVAAMLITLSRIKEVWNKYKTELLAIWDHIRHGIKDAQVSKKARALLSGKLGPSSPPSLDIAKDFATYAKLNFFANHGITEVSEQLGEDLDNDLYQLPSGYHIAQSSDLQDVNEIKLRDFNKKFKKEQPGVFTYNEKTGLIKTPEGLKAMLFIKSDGTAVLSFAGTEGSWGKSGRRLTRGMKANFKQNVAGKVPKIYHQAKELVSILHKQYPGLVLTGFSQGGGLAQYAGIPENLPIYTMNSAGLEIRALANLVNVDDFETKANNVHNIHLEGELVYAFLRGGIGGVLLGNSYEVPIPPGQNWDPVERHAIISLHASLNPDSSAFPSQPQRLNLNPLMQNLIKNSFTYLIIHALIRLRTRYMVSYTPFHRCLSNHQLPILCH